MIVVVGAALVRAGRVLAGLRRNPVGWEFPGGKVDPHETAAQAIVRECHEELAVDVVALEHLATARDTRIELQLWHVDLVTGEPSRGDDHSELRWVDSDALDALDWLAIDRELLPAARALLVRR